MTTLGGIPTEEDHKAPGKRLAGDDSRRLGKTLVGAPARPLPGSLSSPGKTLAEAARPTPTERATLEPTVPNAIIHVGPGLGRHLCGGMQIFEKTYSRSNED